MKQRSYKNLKLIYSFCMIFFILGNLLLGDNMKNTKYDKIADKHKVSQDKMSNAFIAFLSGGVVGLFGELIILSTGLTVSVSLCTADIID